LPGAHRRLPVHAHIHCRRHDSQTAQRAKILNERSLVAADNRFAIGEGGAGSSSTDTLRVYEQIMHNQKD
jgi:hypothetical protein